MDRIASSTAGGVSAAARTAGLGDRFRYWGGRSGRRYLFTAVGPAALDEFRAAVVLLAETGADGRPVARLLTTVDDRGAWRDPEAVEAAIATGARRVFVHLLARDAAERDRAVADLGPAVVADAA